MGDHKLEAHLIYRSSRGDDFIAGVTRNLKLIRKVAHVIVDEEQKELEQFKGDDFLYRLKQGEIQRTIETFKELGILENADNGLDED